MSKPRMRVMLLGATGTIGRATAAALIAAGHEVVAVMRPGGGAALRLCGPSALLGPACKRGAALATGKAEM